MNILEQEDIIKGLPDQALMQEAQMPSGQVPQYLVVSEIQRRSDMRKRYKAEQEQMPQATVKEQVMQEGIMGAMPPQMAMAPQMAQRMPNMPPQGIKQAMPPQMMSSGGVVGMESGGAVYKPLDPRTQSQLDVMIDSDQMGYADILSFINQIPGTPEDRASMMEYVRGRTGALERAGYAFDQFGDRLGSAFNRLTGRSEAEAAQDAQFMDNLQAGSVMRLPTQEEMLQGAPEAERVGITQGALPMPGFGGLAGLLGRQGGKQLATRYNPINVPNFNSARPVALGGAEAVSSLIEGDEEAIGPLEALAGQIPPYEQARQNVSDYFADRFSGLGDFYSGLSDIYNTGLAGLASAVVPGGQIIPEEPDVVKAELKPEIIDDIISGGGIEKKGGGEEVQSASADRMAELLERMGRANRGAALVALGSGIAEGKTMEGGREAANILAKGQQAQTKLEIDATQFDQQMDLLEQRVKNAAKSGNASVIAALVTATTRELEALDTAIGRADEATMRRIESLRNTLSELRRIYMPTSGGADGIYSFGSLATGSPSRAKP